MVVTQHNINTAVFIALKEQFVYGTLRCCELFFAFNFYKNLHKNLVMNYLDKLENTIEKLEKCNNKIQKNVNQISVLKNLQ